MAWIDAVGARHDRGWPDCLDVPAGTSIAGVRFATAHVEIDGLEWHPVVLVDCREP